MNSTLKPTKSQLRLEEVHAKLFSEDSDLIPAIKSWMKHLAFNTFKRSHWSLAETYRHVRIGTRSGRPVYIFSRLDAVVTIAPNDTPTLPALRRSRETLQTVDLFVPFRHVDEWKMEKSGEFTSGFQDLMRYLFLLHAVQNGVEGNPDGIINVVELKAAVLKCVRSSKMAPAIPHRPESSLPRSLNFSDRTAPKNRVSSYNITESANATRAAARSGMQTDRPEPQSLYGASRGSIATDHTRGADNVTMSDSRAPIKGSLATNRLGIAQSLKRKLVRNAEDSSDDEETFPLAPNRRNLRRQTNSTAGMIANHTPSTNPKDLRFGSREVPILVSEGEDYSDETEVDSDIASEVSRRTDTRVDRMPSGKQSCADAVEAARKAAATTGRPEVAMGNAQQLPRRLAMNQNEPQETQPAGIESAAALYNYFGVDAIALIHKKTDLWLRTRESCHPAVVPLGVGVGTLLHDANVVVNFHIVLAGDPIIRPAMTWFAFDKEKQLYVDWSPSSLVHDQMIAEINLHPIFQMWRSEDDFRGLLCLVIILASQDYLGGPYNHRIPIVQECRGQLARMLGKIVQARRDIIAGRERKDKLDAAQALLDLRAAPTSSVESLAGLQRATGADPGAILFNHLVNLLYKRSAEPTFVSIGVHIGTVTHSLPSQQGQPVFAFISPQQGSAFTAPLILTIGNNDQQEWNLLARLENGFAAAMALVQPTPAFSQVQSAEDLLALVSLAILLAAERKTFGGVSHRIPIVPWCRGHLAAMMRQVLTKQNEAGWVRDYDRTSRQYSASLQLLSHNEHNDNPASRASAASSRAMLISRNHQLIDAQTRNAEQMFVWLSQNAEAREAMIALVGAGKMDSSEYRNLQAAVSNRETQMRRCLESGVFALIGASRDVSRQLQE